ncbi:MAG TPA: rhomboid family intramembrane serine protease [candidate division Zixibacteria bacterium]|jgi:membrane associated rhomboid family serine protease
MTFVVRQWSWGGSPVGGSLMPRGVKMLLYANIGVFLLQLFAHDDIVRYFGLSPVLVAGGAVWQPVTYMFLHGGFMHLLFNMFALWMFGRDLELDWGAGAFVRYYFVTGIGAGLVTVAMLWGSPIPTIGASGAVFAILLAFGMTYPNRLIYIWFLFPIKAKYFVMMFGALEFLASMKGSADGIGHFTHLGGLAVGFLYLRLERRGVRLRFPRPFAWLGRWRAKRKAHELRRRWDEQRELMESVDRVLDRINEVGYDHLTDEERRTLERASSRLSSHSEDRS